MAAFYNEIDPFAAAWLRELIKAGHIADGEVDERSIVDIRPSELGGFDQCHFFAGIGVWSHSLRLAGWPDDRPVWTGSCPCQPFSAAGKGGGFDDERHLWPFWHHLIRERRPAIVLGEQVASKDGLNWLDLVCADMEGEGYAIGAVDTCSAGHGAPHIRQRLRFVAERVAGSDVGGQPRPGLLGRPSHPASGKDRQVDRSIDAGGHCWLADAQHAERRPERQSDSEAHRRDGLGGRGDFSQPGPTNGFWRDADWLFCRDGRWRPVEPGTFPLAHGSPARVGRLRGYGNAVDAQATAAFIEAHSELIDTA